MTRPDCPMCGGTRVVKVGGSRTTTAPCSSCDDGGMRGIDDPTAEERRIAELEARLAEVTRRARRVAKAARQRRRILDDLYAGESDCAKCGRLTNNGICTQCRHGTSPFVILERQTDAACGWAFELGRGASFDRTGGRR